MMPDKQFDEKMCADFPKIFCGRNAPMTETCMCWGFETGSGWQNIIHQLCLTIQRHIDQTEENTQWDIKHNEKIASMKAGDFTAFDRDTASWNPDHREKTRAEMLAQEPRKLTDTVPQVVATQIKEKFGTLRFYYTGGDDYIDGLVRMAESMSAVTCETCGNPGERHGGGWVTTLCKEHAEARGIYAEEV